MHLLQECKHRQCNFTLLLNSPHSPFPADALELSCSSFPCYCSFPGADSESCFQLLFLPGSPSVVIVEGRRTVIAHILVLPPGLKLPSPATIHLDQTPFTPSSQTPFIPLTTTHTPTSTKPLFPPSPPPSTPPPSSFDPVPPAPPALAILPQRCPGHHHRLIQCIDPSPLIAHVSHHIIH